MVCGMLKGYGMAIDSIQLLGKLLDVCELRHKVLSGNLANADTPNYVRRDVKFRDALKDAIDAGRPGESSAFMPEIIKDQTRPTDASGNNVDVQDELAAVTENSLMYGVAARMLSGKYSRLKRAISGK
jgi:flagellar basal-body rod protein FlgB